MLRVVVCSVLVLFIVCLPAALASQGPSLVFGSDVKQKLSLVAAVYPGDQQALSFTEAVEVYNRGHFVDSGPQNASRTNFGLTTDDVWLAFEFATSAELHERTFLEVGHASLDTVQSYLLSDGELLMDQQSGDVMPFSEKPVYHRNHVFPLPLLPNRSYQLFLRVSSEGTLTVPVTLWQGDALWRNDQHTYAGLSLYYGVLFALLIYNLFLFFSLRDTLYLTYVGFIGFLGIGQAGLSGLTGQFLWPNSPWLVHLSPTAGVAAAGVFGALFVHRFLASTPKRLRLSWLMPCMSLAYGLTFLTAVFVSYAAAAVAVNLLSMLFAVAALVMGGVSLYLKEPGAKFFVLAWVSFLLGVLVIALHNVGLLPTNTLTTNAMMIGSATEMLLLSLALADRTRALEMTNRALRESQLLLEEQANHDPLTGLSNRKHLWDRLMEAVERSRRSGESFALVVIDLDRFKQINDTYGHSAGDEVLVSIANKLNTLVRSSDTVARIGGDEFVLLLEGIQKDKDLTRLKAELSRPGNSSITLQSGTELEIGLSAGAAIYPDDTSVTEELFTLADADMYREKRQQAGNQCFV